MDKCMDMVNIDVKIKDLSILEILIIINITVMVNFLVKKNL